MELLLEHVGAVDHVFQIEQTDFNELNCSKA